MGLLYWLGRGARALFAPARPAPPRRAGPRWEAAPPARSAEAPPSPAPEVLRGPCWVIDGDTIVVNRRHIRLAGIDAPELDHPWGQKSKWAMVEMCRGQIVTAHVTGAFSYNRIVATCVLPDGTDLAAELVRRGLAIDWPKYSGGKYRHLEQPGVRKRLWRAHARQMGRFPPPQPRA